MNPQLSSLFMLFRLSKTCCLPLQHRIYGKPFYKSSEAKKVSISFIQQGKYIFLEMNKAVSTLYRSNGNKNIAVTLLGFAGAKEAHIQKYAQIYRDRGLVSLSNVTFRFRYDTIHFTSLLPTVYSMNLKVGPYFIEF